MDPKDHYNVALADIAEAHFAFAPPSAMSVVEGVKTTLKIQQTGAPSKFWDPDETPYMPFPMNALASRRHEAVVFVGPARTGKTAGMLVGWLGHTVVNDPGDMLMIQMTQDKAREFSKTDIKRAIDNSPKITEMLSGSASDRNTHDVMFRNGVWLRIAWPTGSNVSGSTYRYVAITDIDRMINAENVDGEGPLFDLGKKRTQTFMSRGMTLVESSPGKPITDPYWKPATPHEAPPTGGILSIYNRSDRHRWYWKCPDCRERFEAAPGLGLFGLPSVDELLTDIRTMDLGAVAKQFARVICPHCGSILPPRLKQDLNRGGLWLPDKAAFDSDDNVVGDPMTSSIRGFWLGGVAAAFQSWQSIIDNYLQGLREYALNGSEEKLKTTTNTDQGAPYLPRHLAEAKAVASTPQSRAVDIERYVVPAWTRCVIASVDVQGGTQARFVVQVHAEGEFGQEQLVDRFEIRESNREGMGADKAPIDPAGFAEDWDMITEKVLRTTWRTPDAAREIKARLVVVDTGGEGKQNGGEGVTANAYAWWRRIREQGLAHRVRLYKGGSNPAAPIIKESMVGGVGSMPGDVPLYVCNPHLLSDIVDNCMRRSTPGPGYYHFPKPKHPVNNPSGWLSEAFYDELQAEVKGPNGVWTQVRQRNESFDLCRMIKAGTLMLGLDKIQDWNVVPPWLAPLAGNSETMTVEARRAMQANTLLTAPARSLIRRPLRRSVATL